jgi:lipoprotein-releasing system permease protein
MKFELYVALRYLKAKRKQTVISVITVISIMGVAAGVMALIVALSISAGFREDLQSKLLRGTAHINVTPVNPSAGIANYPQMADQIKKVEGVRSATPAIYQNVLINSGTRQYVVTLKGLDTLGSALSKEDFFEVKQGNIQELASRPDDPIKDRIAIGQDLAKNLGISVGEFVNAISAEGALSPFGYVPRQKRFKVVAIFSSGLYEFDSAWGFTSLGSAQRLFGSGNLVSVIECRVRDIYQVRAISQQIKQTVGHDFVILDWQELNRPIFEALKLEKLVMVITIGLIVFVAALNIITTLVMMVMEKNRDIAVLMSMGATRNNIRRIFVYQGLIIGVVGALLGVIGGVFICWVCDRYRLVHLQADVYSISYVPFKISPYDILAVALAAVAISFLATLHPSKSAACLDPAEALRYE